jgi:iron complex outermembrane receptor protein
MLKPGALRARLPFIVAASAWSLMANARTDGVQTPLTTTSAQAGTLEEIVVTAQKREQSLQDTSIAITAFTDATIARTGVGNIADLAEKAPNVTFKFTAPISGASNAATVFIRGIGQSDFALTTDPGVGTYVDGVYVSRSVGGVLDVLDLKRVEILRGPQGTLFGRNSIGGAISLITKTPSFDDTGGNFQVTGGSRNQLYLRGSLNVPLADTLAVRIAASSKNRDGYVNTAFSPSSPYYAHALTNLGNEDRQAVRADILWKPLAQFDVNLAADYSRVRENNAPAVLVGVTGAKSPADGPIVFLYNAFQAPTTTLSGFPNGQYSASNFVTGRNDLTYATGPNGTRLDSYGTALTLTYALRPEVSVKSITAWHHEGGTFARDADGSPVVLTDNIDTDYQHEQFSQELQLTGAALDDGLKFAAGLYYFAETGSDPLIVEFPSSFGLLNIFEDKVHNSSDAAYGQAVYAITKALSLTAGVRYTKDKKRFLTNQTLTITGPGGTAATGAPPGTVVPLVPPNSDVAQTFSNTSPHVSLDYKVTDTALVYASFSEGFKSGGFNLRYVVPRAAVRIFGPEKVDAYEVGAKLENAMRTLQLNIAAFTTAYHNVQLTYFESFGAPVTANGGDARIDGVEVEFKAKPAEGLNIGLSVGYLDAHYTSLSSGLNAGATTPEQFITLNSRLPNTPRWQPSADIDYSLPIPRHGSVLFAADVRYSSVVYNDAQNSAFLRQGGYGIADTSISYSPEHAAWSVRAYVENVADKRYIVSGDSNYGIGFHEAEFNRPREYGAGFTYNF